jgi:hypothetical protein
LLAIKHYRIWWKNLPKKWIGTEPEGPRWVCRLCEGKKCVNDGPTHYSKKDLEPKLAPLQQQLQSWRGQAYPSDETNKKVDIANYRVGQLEI